MTDQITDQDRRMALAFAREIGNLVSPHTGAAAAARIILATVEAPEPTFAEELREVGARYKSNIMYDVPKALAALATRAEQMETEWEEELDQISADRDHWIQAYGEAAQDRDYLAAEIDKANTDILHLTAERDEARAEVERLTAELETETVALEENVAADQQANTQGTLSGALPNPADVPEGQAWIVEYHGDDLPALRRLDHPGDWYLVRKNGTGGHVRSQDITLVSRLVPAPRQITTREELDGLPRRTVIRDADGVTCERASIGAGWYTTESTSDQTGYIKYPATVLYTPEVEA